MIFPVVLSQNICLFHGPDILTNGNAFCPVRENILVHSLDIEDLRDVDHFRVALVIDPVYHITG